LLVNVGQIRKYLGKTPEASKICVANFHFKTRSSLGFLATAFIINEFISSHCQFNAWASKGFKWQREWALYGLKGPIIRNKRNCELYQFNFIFSESGAKYYLRFGFEKRKKKNFLLFLSPRF
jgi:hypothetical protein